MPEKSNNTRMVRRVAGAQTFVAVYERIQPEAEQEEEPMQTGC